MKSIEGTNGHEENLEGAAQDIVSSLLYDTNIYVVGVGGCGCNTVEYISKKEMTNVKTIGINTDKNVLEYLDVDRQMLIGKDLMDGNGTGGDPNLGERAARLNEEHILKALDGAQMVIIVAGLGGGTGSGASKVVADLARRNGKLVVSYMIMPFSIEGERHDAAKGHLEDISLLSNTTTVFENDKALIVAGKKPVSEAFQVASKMLHKVVKRLKMDYIAEFFHEFGLDETNMSETLFEDEIEEDFQEIQKVEEPPVIDVAAAQFGGISAVIDKRLEQQVAHNGG
ncbi:MAG: hypothetical protein R6U17_08860 [Thermoplasmata archaeon]